MIADICDLWRAGHYVCVTTNGYVKKDASGVMGRGNAKAMADLIKPLPSLLGLHLRTYGNHVGFIYKRVIAFPVKPEAGRPSDALTGLNYTGKVPGFHCKAQLSLIERSAEELIRLIEYTELPLVYLPMPGVGNGGLSENEVLNVSQLNHKKIMLVTI